MAPVAGTIAATEEHRLIFGFSLGEGFFAPGIPVYRVVGVLREDKEIVH